MILERAKNNNVTITLGARVSTILNSGRWGCTWVCYVISLLKWEHSNEGIVELSWLLTLLVDH
jgi:hypothetical protein